VKIKESKGSKGGGMRCKARRVQRGFKQSKKEERERDERERERERERGRDLKKTSKTEREQGGDRAGRQHERKPIFFVLYVLVLFVSFVTHCLLRPSHVG
jgi:Flp pilus assembly protein TadB